MTAQDSWATAQSTALPSAHRHQQRLTSVRAERLLRCLLETGSLARSSTTASSSAGGMTAMDSWATVVRPARTPTHRHPQRLTSARAEQPLRWRMGGTKLAPSSTTASRSAGDLTIMECWAMGGPPTRTSTPLHPQRLTLARAARPLRCLLANGTPAPSLTTVK